jgi:hypothetical protein
MNAGSDEQRAADSYGEATDALASRPLRDPLAFTQNLIDAGRLDRAWAGHHAAKDTDQGRKAALEFTANAAQKFKEAGLVGLAADAHDDARELAALLGDTDAAIKLREKADSLRQSPGAG